MRAYAQTGALRGAFVCALTIVGTLFSEPAQAQIQFNVGGVVADSAGNGLNGAMVVALSLPDSVLARFSLSDDDGSFTLSRVPTGEYVLQVTLVGHQTVRQDLSVSGADVFAGTISLPVMALAVAPLVVTVDQIPFANRRDTLDYNVLAFETRPNATVEDLLQRLPGIEVATDGSILAQGQDVQNVLVDGKEFFGSDPTIATKNLPADAIQRVQVYDRQSDIAEFTGIPDGQEEVTINLELKDGAKRGYFGGAAGGLGGGLESASAFDAPGNDRVRYDETLSINRFSDATQLAVIAATNNVNQAGFAYGDYLSFVGGSQGLAAEGGRDGSGIQIGGGRNDGFTTSLAVGLNASHDFNSGSWIRSSYFLSDLDNLQNRGVQQQLLLGLQASSLLDQTTEQTTQNLTHRFNLNAQHTFAEGHDLRLRGNVNWGSSSLTSIGQQETTSPSGQRQNTASTGYVVDGDELGGNTNLTWRKRLSESGRSLIVEARANLSEPNLFADLTSSTSLYDAGNLVGRDDVLQEQSRTGRTFSQSQRVSLTEPFSPGYVLELFGERSAIDEDQAKLVSDLGTGTPVLNDLLSSEFERTYSYLRGGLRFNHFTTDWRMVLGLQVQGSDLDGTVIDRNEQIRNGYTHFLPSANFNYQFRPGQNLRLLYATSTREPSMTELQPFLDNNNPLNAYQGNPNLTPEYSHSVNTEYRLFDQFSFMNLFTFLRVSYTANDIVFSRDVDSQARQVVTPVNSGARWTTNTGVTFGRPIRPIGARINLNYSVAYSTGSEFVNQAENVSRTLRNTVEVSLENRVKDVFDVRGGARFLFNNVDYSLSDELNQGYLNRIVYGSGSYYLGAWTVAASLDYQLYDQDVFGPGQNVALFGASISRYMVSNRVEVRMAGFDLLNQNQGVTFTNAAGYIEQERIESLGRHVMMRVSYKLGPGGGT